MRFRKSLSHATSSISASIWYKAIRQTIERHWGVGRVKP